MYVCICIYIYICMYVCMYVYIYIYIHTHSFIIRDRGLAFACRTRMPRRDSRYRCCVLLRVSVCIDVNILASPAHESAFCVLCASSPFCFVYACVPLVLCHLLVYDVYVAPGFSLMSFPIVFCDRALVMALCFEPLGGAAVKWCRMGRTSFHPSHTSLESLTWHLMVVIIIKLLYITFL